MKRLLPLAVLAGLGLAGATALAAQTGRTSDPYSVAEPNVSSGQVLKLQGSSPCDDTRSTTVRVTPPVGAVLGYVRVVVDTRQSARLTGVPRAASATVRVPRSGARVTATALTLGGQKLRVSRVYSDCEHPQSNPPSPVGGGGEG